MSVNVKRCRVGTAESIKVEGRLSGVGEDVAGRRLGSFTHRARWRVGRNLYKSRVVDRAVGSRVDGGCLAPVDLLGGGGLVVLAGLG